jgi:hypothetical protein
VAEGLIERIGAEIDKRVDARLAQAGTGGQPAPASRQPWPMIVLGLGSMGIGFGITATVVSAGVDVVGPIVRTSVSAGQVALVAFIWVIIGVINVAYARRR